MKKKNLTAIALIIALTLTACGGSNNDSTGILPPVDITQGGNDSVVLPPTASGSESVGTSAVIEPRGTMTLDKTAYELTDSVMIITVSGITQEMIWAPCIVATFEEGADHSMWLQKNFVNEIDCEVILPVPAADGNYEVRMYLSEKFSDNTFYISVPFTVGDIYKDTEYALTIVNNSGKDIHEINITLIDYENHDSLIEYYETTINIDGSMVTIGDISYPEITGTILDNGASGVFVLDGAYGGSAGKVNIYAQIGAFNESELIFHNHIEGLRSGSTLVLLPDKQYEIQ